MNKFLKPYRTKSKTEYNFLCLFGKKWNIPVDQLDSFWTFFSHAKVPEKCGFVFRPNKCGLQPVFIDVDLHFNEETEITDKQCITFSEECCFAAQEIRGDVEFDVAIVRKQTGYFKKLSTGTVYKNGFHIYMFGEMKLTLPQNRTLRSKIMGFVQEHFPTTINDSANIIDAALTERKNGLCLITTVKNKNTGGQYQCILRATYKSGFWNERDAEWCLQNQINLLQDVYHFLKKPKQKLLQEAQVAPQIVTAPTANDADNMFNLKKFREALGEGWRPRHSDESYQDLMFFLIKQKFEPKETATFLNEWWHETSSENQRFLEKYEPQDVTVGVGSIVQILKNCAANPWNRNEIFGRKIYEFYNEYTVFTRNIHCLTDVHNFLSDTVKYAFKNKVYLWQIKVSGEVDNIATEISKNAPFSGQDDFIVTLYPTKSELREKLSELPQITPEIQQILDTIDSTSVPRLVVRVANTVPTLKLTRETPMSKILKNAQLRCIIPRFTSLDFVPYTTVDPTDKHTINTFSGFPLQPYLPKRVVNIEDTLLYRYFVDVWGSVNTVTQKHYVCPVLEDLWNRFAFRIQYPAIRSEKLTILRSDAQGLGKSFIFQIWNMLLGSELTVFHINLKSYITNFNMNNSSRMIHFIDDLNSCSRASVCSRCVRRKNKSTRRKGKNQLRFKNSQIFGSQEMRSRRCPSKDVTGGKLCSKLTKRGRGNSICFHNSPKRCVI